MPESFGGNRVREVAEQLTRAPGEEGVDQTGWEYPVIDSPCFTLDTPYSRASEVTGSIRVRFPCDFSSFVQRKLKRRGYVSRHQMRQDLTPFVPIGGP